LLRIIDRYYRNVQFERAAPPLSGTLDRLGEIREAAKAFSTALAQRGNRPASTEPEIAQAAAALRYINEYREEKRSPTSLHGLLSSLAAPHFPAKLEDIWEHVSELTRDLQNCEAMVRDAAEKRYPFQDGEAWKEFARAVRRWARHYEMPDGVRKDDAGQSPFVLMFYAMQREFADDFQRHQHSHSALATALSAAFKDVRVS